MVKPWSSDEIERLTALFPTMPTKEVASHFDRPLSAVSTKAVSLGLRKTGGYSAPHPKQWSAADTAKLIALFPVTPLKELAQALGRPYAGLYSKCNALGLKKSNEYRKEYLAVSRLGTTPFVKGQEPWNKKPLVTLCCKWCKNDFQVVNARVGRAVFCKRTCMSAWRKTIVGEAHWLDTKVKRNCKWCNKVFRAKKAVVENGEGHYCSRNCLGSAQSYTMGQHKGPTSIEVKMQAALESRKIEHIAQHPIGPWCVDFFIPSLNMVIECDGDYWHGLENVKARDKRKNGYLKHHGYTLHRVTETDIKTRLDEALTAILPLAA